MAERRVRVRFAPSPTGALHIGGVRTALYNYLFARQHGGDLVFRIEDTDSNRFVPGAEEYIIESFKWLGIKFDEGVSFGGEHGPYRQSERRDIYKKYVQQLLDAGKAYIAFDTPEELEAKRAEIQNFQYDASTRMQMRNSLSMTKEEVDTLIADELMTSIVDQHRVHYQGRLPILCQCLCHSTYDVGCRQYSRLDAVCPHGPEERFHLRDHQRGRQRINTLDAVHILVHYSGQSSGSPTTTACDGLDVCLHSRASQWLTPCYEEDLTRVMILIHNAEDKGTAFFPSTQKKA